MVYLRFTGKTHFMRFQLLYSFHELAAQPSRANSGLWNCSVPVWSNFERHFRCNLDRECEQGEDENQCDYAGFCGQDLLTLDGRCYRYVHVHRRRRISWRRSDLNCRRQGGYLVSLNTPRERQTVVSTLRMRRTHKRVFVGLKEAPSVLPVMYKNTHMWADKTVFFHRSSLRVHKVNFCGQFQFIFYDLNQNILCDRNRKYTDYLCEFDSPQSPANQPTNRHPRPSLHFPRNTTLAVPYVTCPSGHLTHVFLACDIESACWSSCQNSRRDSEAWRIPFGSSLRLATVTSLPPMFTCSLGSQRVPYSLVCDHRRQCDDNSDENFCVFPPCAEDALFKCRRSDQCIPLSAFCDGQGDCTHGIDEAQCRYSATKTHPPPAVANFRLLEKYRLFTTTRYVLGCPKTHFQCQDNGYCMPVFLMCNGVNDCPGREDEAWCGDSVSCPGFYRCRSSTICLYPSHVCDGVYQCPEQDDEVFCGVLCPTGCTCYGLEFLCQQGFQAKAHTKVRYLDASNSRLIPSKLKECTMLIHLSLSKCMLKSFHNMTFPNLRILDLSHNRIIRIDANDLRGLTNLQFLSLSNNPLKAMFPVNAEQLSFQSLKVLDVSGVRMQTLNTRRFSPFPGLRVLNLSQCGVEYVTGPGLQTTRLHTLNILGCPMHQFPRDLLSGLEDLRAVQADNFKLCCPATLPAGFHVANCKAPFDEVSSCDSLLRSHVYIVFLSVFSTVSLTGNLVCFLTRIFTSRSGTSGFLVFVTHLSISDFLMGTYLAIIGVADRLYKGSYLWDDVWWRHSVACKVAGFVSLLSNEVSAFIICLITLDRFLVLRFPFSSLHFQARSAHATCAVVWVLVTAMAAIPLTPMTSQWSFYSQTGICIPLPVTRKDFPGRLYAFGILIVFNFIMFLLIVAGQAVIYASVRANSLSTADSTKKSKDLRIARRLVSVALSDFMCWFPIGLLGLLSSRGVPISGEVNVGMAIMVLPLNSALNPFLYTINVMLERRRRRHDENMVKQLMAQMREGE